MKLPVYGLKGEAEGEIKIEKLFSESVRPDLIKRAVLTERLRKRQPYGADPLAGKRTSAHYHGRRGIRNSMMNREMARMKRIHTMGFLNYTARFVPQAVKGRKAHPPKVEKVLGKKINNKEKQKALFSAISASANKKIIVSRGHEINSIKHIPIIVKDSLQELKKSKEIKDTLKKLGLDKELKRASKKKIRSGRGRMRGRKYKTKKGPLIIIAQDKGIRKASQNIPGVDTVFVKTLRVSDLAPGCHPGRLCIWTRSAIEEMEKKA